MRKIIVLLFMIILCKPNIANDLGSTPVDGLVGEWNFGWHTQNDGGGWINNFDPGRNDASLGTGTEDLEYSQYGWGTELDGTDDWIDYGLLSDIPGWDDTAFSFGGIVVGGIGNGQFTNWFGIVQDPPTGISGDTEGIWVGDHQGNLRISSNGETPSSLGSTNLVDGDTYHVIITNDGTTVRGYLNGVEEPTATLSGTDYQLATNLVSGASNVGGDDYSNVTIVTARVWTRTLTPSEVWNDYQSYKSKY